MEDPAQQVGHRGFVGGKLGEGVAEVRGALVAVHLDDQAADGVEGRGGGCGVAGRHDERLHAGGLEGALDKAVEVRGDNHLDGPGADQPGNGVVGPGRLLKAFVELGVVRREVRVEECPAVAGRRCEVLEKLGVVGVLAVLGLVPSCRIGDVRLPLGGREAANEVDGDVPAGLDARRSGGAGAQEQGVTARAGMDGRCCRRDICRWHGPTIRGRRTLEPCGFDDSSVRHTFGTRLQAPSAHVGTRMFPVERPVASSLPASTATPGS